MANRMRGPGCLYRSLTNISSATGAKTPSIAPGGCMIICRQSLAMTILFWILKAFPRGQTSGRLYIKNAISDCDVFLALIGEQWLSLIRNRSDLDQPDYVKIELEAALSSGLLVVPILVDDTEMPREADLPAELQPLSSLNSIRLRYDHFASDVKTILQNIDRSLVIHQQGKIHDPVAAIAGAASHEKGFSGRFRLEVKSTG